MVSDRVGDFIIRLKNAGAIGNRVVSLPHSKHLEAIALKLKELGYVERVEVGKKDHPTLEVTLSYDERGAHKIRGVKRISKPGRRLYVQAHEAHNVKNGQGSRIISTPRGVLTDAEARKVRAGGENLFEIW
ncbi:MAG TPA: 30S ribosomal protein S8 [Candidatus Paceibacterota bacterium]|jgi:small subunit ribosomal protein S8